MLRIKTSDFISESETFSLCIAVVSLTGTLSNVAALMLPPSVILMCVAYEERRTFYMCVAMAKDPTATAKPPTVENVNTSRRADMG